MKFLACVTGGITAPFSKMKGLGCADESGDSIKNSVLTMLILNGLLLGAQEDLPTRCLAAHPSL